MTLVKKINAKISRFADQYFYSELVGTYVVDTAQKLVLIDLPSYSKEIEKYLSSFKKPMFALLSHGSCGISDGTIWQQKIGLKVYLHQADKNSEWLRMRPDVLFVRPPKLAPNLEVILTPGHTPGSICVCESTSKALFTGDTFGGLPNGEINDFLKGAGDFYGDLKERFVSCKKLLKYDFENALPFHYEMIMHKAKESLLQFVDLHVNS